MPNGDAAPGAPLPAAVGPEPGAEDHHAFEADVDHADPLGEQAAEAGQQPIGTARVRAAPDGAVGGQVGGAGRGADQAEQDEDGER